MHFDSYADLILHGGKLTTLDPANPAATALAVQGDRILTVGSYEQALLHFCGLRTTVIDLGGFTANGGGQATQLDFPRGTDNGNLFMILDLDTLGLRFVHAGYPVPTHSLGGGRPASSSHAASLSGYSMRRPMRD